MTLPSSLISVASAELLPSKAVKLVLVCQLFPCQAKAMAPSFIREFSSGLRYPTATLPSLFNALMVLYFVWSGVDRWVNVWWLTPDHKSGKYCLLVSSWILVVPRPPTTLPSPLIVWVLAKTLSRLPCGSGSSVIMLKLSPVQTTGLLPMIG